ncbi:MAG: FAD-binding oxidoreductase [Nitrospiraceae bacterium]|nr:FAD-binding oxidoreductase [Nitrospiraceae bacterium]
MRVQTFTAQVESIKNLTHDVRQLDLQLIEPKTITFKAGQFISFEMPHPQTGHVVTRPYSIASQPSRSDVITLLFNLVPGGPGSTYLFSLKEGDKVHFKGPAGNFYLREDPGREPLFIASGTGIAPIRSMLLADAERPDPKLATLFWGLRGQRDLYYQEELAELTRRTPTLTAITTLSRPEPGWPGESGRVLRLIEERIASVKNLAVYLCGNSAMIADATSLLQKQGLCPIYREKYYDDTGSPDD